MPCQNIFHAHDWPRSGSLSISKCESKCGFCASTKDYKPASALRKHVLTHIKNDGMPLTLEKSTGGRLRLQTVSVAPIGLAQPELPPSSFEISLATEPVLGYANAKEDNIDDNDNVLNSSNNVLAMESHLTYSYRVASIIENTKSGKDAVHLLRSLGSPEDLVKEAFDDLEICLIEIGYINLWEWLRRLHSIGWFWAQIDRDYPIFLQALQGMVQPSSPATAPMVLEVFYATMILSVIRGALYDLALIPRRRRLELTEDGSSTTRFEAHSTEWPIFIVLERPNEVLSELFDFRGIRYHPIWLAETRCFEPSQWKFMMVLNVPFESHLSRPLVERLGDCIDQYLDGLPPTVPPRRDQERRWNLEWEELYKVWYTSYSDNGTGGPRSSRSQNSAT